MGSHRHDFAEVAGANLSAEKREFDAAPLPMETELEFFSRRALEEARLAQLAPSPAAANAHRYLAAAYSEQLSKYMKVHAEMEELLNALS